MLFTCPGTVARGGTPRRAGRGRAHAGVDIHCHVQCPAADEMVKDVPRPGPDPAQQFSNDLTRATNRKQMENVWSCLTSVDQRLRDMDKMGMDVQAISPSPSTSCTGCPRTSPAA